MKVCGNKQIQNNAAKSIDPAYVELTVFVKLVTYVKKRLILKDSTTGAVLLIILQPQMLASCSKFI